MKKLLKPLLYVLLAVVVFIIFRAAIIVMF